MAKQKYVVIGGQYKVVYYGVVDTLHKAKILATNNVEYWDNWQGWHTPLIYRYEDTEPCIQDGYEILVPKPDAEVYAWKVCDRWEVIE